MNAKLVPMVPMRLTSLSSGASTAAVDSQSPVKATSAAGSESGGLQKIRGQSHQQSGKGFSEGLKWRDAKTLGLGVLAQGLLNGASWLFRGMGAMLNTLSNRAVAHGERLQQKENPSRYTPGLGYAAKGLGYILKAPALLLKGASVLTSLGARPAGQAISGMEKLSYLAAKGMGKAALAGAQSLVHSPSQSQPGADATLKDAVDLLVKGGHRISPQQISALALHLSDPLTHAWPAELDPALKALLSTSTT